MKNRLLLLILPVLLLAACKKEQGNFNKAGLTLFQTIKTDSQLTLYRAALTRAGMFDDAVFGNGPFTVFAPVDSALINAGLTKDIINGYDTATLAGILRYAMVYGRIGSASLIGFYSQDVLSLNTSYQPRLTKNYYGIFLDGIALVKNGSFELGDGVLHKMQRLPHPPAGNLMELIGSSPDLSYYAAAINHIGWDFSGAPNTGQTDDNGKYYTLFAPTNEAFIKFGFPDIDAINNSDVSQMQNWITNFRLYGKLFTSGFLGGYSFVYQYYYVQADGLTIITAGNLYPTHIIRPDVVATNGVLQVVDQFYLTR